MRFTPVSQPFFIISSMWCLVMASVTYCSFFLWRFSVSGGSFTCSVRYCTHTHTHKL